MPRAVGRARPVLVDDASVAPVDAVEPLESWAQRVYPFKYLRCPVCQVPARQYCVVRSGRVVDGRPDEAVQRLERPHSKRKISRARVAR